MKYIKLSFLFFFLSFGFSVFGQYYQYAAHPEAINYYNEGVKAQTGGNSDDALTAYQKALFLAHNDTKLQNRIINNMGIIYAKKGLVKQAEQAFKEVIFADPDYRPAKVNLGLIYEQYGDRVMALEYWAEALNWDNLKPKAFVVGETLEPETN
ncbi:MAG: hypothetical protein JW867_03010 [Candidatus Omnitrophica bacterium]|nr:hypothetical protein [Candidatus Omnitrophota bacterium]